MAVRGQPVLVTEEDHLPLQQRLLDLPADFVGQRLGQVDAFDLSADVRGERGQPQVEVLAWASAGHCWLKLAAA
jgi:hypothetical protein